MPNCELSTPKRHEKVNLDIDDEVIVIALEPIVWLFFDDNDDIPRNHPRSLVTLAGEDDRLASLHAFVNMDLEHLLLRNHLARVAVLALIAMVDNLASSGTFITRLLQLLDHGTHLTQRNAHATTLARPAWPDSTLLAALAVALWTDYVTRQR